MLVHTISFSRHPFVTLHLKILFHALGPLARTPLGGRCIFAFENPGPSIPPGFSLV